MAKRKRQRMFSREQRAANRAAVAAERVAVGEPEWLRRNDVAYIYAFGGEGASESPQQLAELYEDGEFEPDVDEMIARHYERLTGRRLDAAEKQRVFEEAEDRAEAAAEAAWYRARGVEL